jgi:hypothetical protein
LARNVKGVTDVKDVGNLFLPRLGHESREAAKESFAGFRQDPEWLAAREASEKAAGGLLTMEKNGVVSEFLVPAEYSPLQ